MTYQESYDAISAKSEDLGLSTASFNSLMAYIGEIHRFYQCEIDVLKRDAIKHGREIEAMKDLMKRVYEENNAKLMAVFYSLDTLKSCGTHHEKRVVLTHLMAIVNRMINKETEGISYKNDDLPF